MPQPEGAQLEAVRARREQLKEKYLRPKAERAATTVGGVHHLALVARDVEDGAGLAHAVSLLAVEDS